MPESPVLAETDPAIVRPDPLVFYVRLEQVKTLDIILENAIDVYGIDVQGQFDVEAIEVVDANLTKFGIQMIPGTIPKPDLVMFNSADNDLGTFMYVTTQMNPTLPSSGSGIVFSIQVRGLKIGVSAFTITSVLLGDIDGMSLPVTTQNGTIRVSFFFYLPIVQN